MKKLAVLAILLILGPAIPMVFIPDVQADTEPATEHAPRYALVRVDSARGPVEHLVGLKMSVVDVRPDPAQCDWGYREPIAAIVTVRVYTLWGIPIDTWEVTCDTEQRVS